MTFLVVFTNVIGFRVMLDSIIGLGSNKVNVGHARSWTFDFEFRILDSGFWTSEMLISPLQRNAPTGHLDQARPPVLEWSEPPIATQIGHDRCRYAVSAYPPHAGLWDRLR